MYSKRIIEVTAEFARDYLKQYDSSHDWWHTQRVWKMAEYLAKKENASLLVVQLAAILHDIADPKYHEGDEEKGPEIARKFLQRTGISQNEIKQIVDIIRNISFKNSLGEDYKGTKEFMVVQDADRLDAIGAIGIARTFNYGGYKNRPIYDPVIPPKPDQSKEEYKNSIAPTINHFYEKLLLLKDRMNTRSAKKIAARRHKFMLDYLKTFMKEWDGE
jgi:uncharacterized protein